MANGKTFRQVYGPRGVIHSWADGKGGQKVEDTGPLTKKRMETVDDETLAAAEDFIKRQNDAGQPFFVWWNATRMHFRTHVKEEHRGISGQDEYSDGMVEHDMMVGELLNLLDELGIADNTIVLYSTDNGPHYNTWPDAATTPFHGEKTQTGKAPSVFLLLFAGRVIFLLELPLMELWLMKTGYLHLPPLPEMKILLNNSEMVLHLKVAPIKIISMVKIRLII
ncbi:MAG: sulfatase-like hydrolase/transferase [Bacteroidales bacterium]